MKGRSDKLGLYNIENIARIIKRNKERLLHYWNGRQGAILKSYCIVTFIASFVLYYSLRFLLLDGGLEEASSFLRKVAYLFVAYWLFFGKLKGVPGDGWKEVETKGVVQFSIRGLAESFLALRLPCALLFSAICLDYVSGLSYAEYNALGDSRLIPVITAMLAPLVAWISIRIKKDIEIGKKREQWGSDLKESISMLLILSRVVWRKAEVGSARAKVFHGHIKKAKGKEDIMAEVEAAKNILELNYDIDKDIIALGKIREKLEISLKDQKGEFESRVLLKVREVCRWQRCLLLMLNAKRVRETSGKLEIDRNVLNSQIRKAKSKYEKARRGLRDEARVYFRKEWRRIKNISDSVVVDMMAAGVIGFTIIFCYVYVYIVPKMSTWV